jgi:hypothetical protein
MKRKTVDESVQGVSDALDALMGALEAEHGDCGIAIAALTRCLREALDATKDGERPTESQRDEWAAVLRQWGVE